MSCSKCLWRTRDCITQLPWPPSRYGIRDVLRQLAFTFGNVMVPPLQRLRLLLPVELVSLPRHHVIHDQLNPFVASADAGSSYSRLGCGNSPAQLSLAALMRSLPCHGMALQCRNLGQAGHYCTAILSLACHGAALFEMEELAGQQTTIARGYEKTRNVKWPTTIRNPEPKPRLDVSFHFGAAFRQRRAGSSRIFILPAG